MSYLPSIRLKPWKGSIEEAGNKADSTLLFRLTTKLCFYATRQSIGSVGLSYSA